MTEEKKFGQFFREVVEEKQLRMMQARKEDSSIWINFTTFGVLGWTVVLPTLIGVAIGIWLDKSYPSNHSYTLMLLAGGLMFGCLSGWSWIEGERKKIASEEAQLKELARKDIETKDDSEKKTEEEVE